MTKHQKESEKYTCIPEFLKLSIIEIFRSLTPATITMDWANQEGEYSFHVSDCKKTHLALSVSDGMLDEVYKVIMFHEVILEIASSIYADDLLGYELSKIFLLISRNQFKELESKLNIDYANFKRVLLSEVK